MILVLLLAAPLLANGDLSHLWITSEALRRLPEGEPRALLSDPAVADMLANGSIFPDGGYAVNDGYGEIAHWEPFQRAYADWIRAAWGPPPYEGEAAEHAAFLFGMTSHGIADQVYDALYMERAHAEDAASDWAAHSMDEATDVAFAALVGPQDYGGIWVPDEVMAELMAEAAGHEVAADTIHSGQVMVRIATEWAARAGEIEDTVARYERQFPWATRYQLDPRVLGNPPGEAEAVAATWQALWRALEDPAADLGTVLRPWPADGWGIPGREAGDPRARVALLFSRGLSAANAEQAAVEVDCGAGALPLTLRLFYGEHSHVLLVEPAEGWPASALCALSVPGGMPFADPATLPDPAPFATSFRTGPPAPVGCAARPGPARPWLVLVGACLWGALQSDRSRQQRKPTSGTPRSGGRGRRAQACSSSGRLSM